MKVEDIWNKIEKKHDSGCWEWQGSLVNGKYGKALIENKISLIHRVMYELTHGEIPNNLLVLHKCDNPKCCNPEHLFLGTQLDNVRDMTYKGRDKRYHKLEKEDVLEIRRLYSSGNYTQKVLGEMFNVDRRNISFIVNNKTWIHVKD